MNDGYSKTFEVRWAECDMNQHMRHTAYGDYGAHVRIAWLSEKGLTVAKFNEMGVGPVLTREELRYLREIGPHQNIRVNVALAGLSEDGSMWRFFHEIFRQDGKLAATITASGVWMNLNTRRKSIPPAEAHAVFQSLPKSEDFQVLIDPKKL